MFRRTDPLRERGQMIALFALAGTGIILAVGLVIDGGNALAQRRATQNAADFAALSGARVISLFVAGDGANGTDTNVRTAISEAVRINGGSPIAFGAPNGPVYIKSDGTVNPSTGAPTSYVGNGVIPSGTAGVKVGASRSWQPFFLGIIGVGTWTASAEAAAKGGYAANGPAGPVFPVGIAEAFFDGRTACGGPISSDPTSPCFPAHMTPGTLNVPGGFGWLKFGCAGFGLGQNPPASDGGCANNKPFLQNEIGPPGRSFGCCTQVGGAGSPDKVGNLPGNKVNVDCSYYIDNNVLLWVPVWDEAGGTGQNAWYHIVGFTGFQLTVCENGGKHIEGVWRVPMSLGPTTSTPGFAGAPLAVQLVR